MEKCIDFDDVAFLEDGREYNVRKRLNVDSRHSEHCKFSVQTGELLAQRTHFVANCETFILKTFECCFSAKCFDSSDTC